MFGPCCIEVNRGIEQRPEGDQACGELSRRANLFVLSEVCQALAAKIFCFRLSEICGCVRASRTHERGVTRRHERGARDAMDANGSADERRLAYGEGVWSRSPDAGIKLCYDAKRRWLESPAHRGEHAISRKPLRGECRLFRLNLCCLRAQCAFSLHARLAGAASIRCSPRPLFREGHRRCITRA